jgi:hypothetical protein
MPDPTPVGSIATAIAEGFKLLKTVMDTAEVRRMRAAIQAGESYIRVNKKDGEYANIEDKQQGKLLLHFEKRFFKYNN